MHPSQDRAVIGDIAPGKVVLNRQRIYVTSQQRVRDQPLQLRGESQATIAEWRIEQRLHAKPITREEQRSRAQIINRKSEHAVQPRQAVGTPALPGGQNNLAIAVSMEFST